MSSLVMTDVTAVVVVPVAVLVDFRDRERLGALDFVEDPVSSVVTLRPVFTALAEDFALILAGRFDFLVDLVEVGIARQAYQNRSIASN